MRVALRDHSFDSRSVSSWQRAITKHFKDADVAGTSLDRGDYRNTLVFLHPDDDKFARLWFEKVNVADDAALLLVGTQGYSGARAYRHSTKVHYCDWSPGRFHDANEEPIRRFIESVRAGTPEWSALSPSGTLSALSILCQGYLAVRASQLLDEGRRAEAEEIWSVLGCQSSDSEEKVLSGFGSEENWTKVQQPKWWLDVFGSGDYRAAGKTLSAAVEFEWPNSKRERACDILVTVLETATTERKATALAVQEDVVKAAFEAIGRRIRV